MQPKGEITEYQLIVVKRGQIVPQPRVVRQKPAAARRLPAASQPVCQVLCASPSSFLCGAHVTRCQQQQQQRNMQQQQQSHC
eukprot:3242799-Amphidinium_carterae.1